MRYKGQTLGNPLCHHPYLYPYRYCYQYPYPYPYPHLYLQLYPSPYLYLPLFLPLCLHLLPPLTEAYAQLPPSRPMARLHMSYTPPTYGLPMARLQLSHALHQHNFNGTHWGLVHSTMRSHELSEAHFQRYSSLIMTLIQR